MGAKWQAEQIIRSVSAGVYCPRDPAVRARASGSRKLFLAAVLAALCAFETAQARDPLAEPARSPALERFAEVLEQIKTHYVERVDEEKLIRDAIGGVLRGLDPHSAYLESEAFRALKAENRGRFGGLGLEVAMEGRMLKVIAALEDTPAHRAGLGPGDFIIRLGDASVEGMSLEQAIQRTRGEPGTAVTLTVLRKDETEPRELVLTRAVIQNASVRAGLIAPDCAYVRVTQFHEETPRQLVAALVAIFESSPDAIRGLILDLRGNPGGILRSAIGVSAAFLPRDALVVYTDGAGEASRMRLLANGQYYLRRNQADYLEQLPPAARALPMVVLVDSGSASAAEIVAGALQDHKRAIVVGTRTYGKGSVQAIIPLRDEAALTLTTAHYFTPSGRRIQGVGLMPDIVVAPAPVAAGAAAGERRDVAVQRQRAQPRESAMAPPCSPAKPVDATSADSVTVAPQVARGTAQSEDCQLEQAVDLLRNLERLDRS